MRFSWISVIADLLYSIAKVNVKSTRIIVDVGNHHLEICVMDRL